MGGLGLYEAKKRLRAISFKGYSVKEARVILKKEGFSHAIISGAIVESKIKTASRRMHRHPDENRRIMYTLMTFVLIGVIILSTYLFNTFEGTSGYFLFFALWFVKSVVLILTVDAFRRGEIRWALVLLFICLPIPILDIIGGANYYLTRKSNRVN